MAMKTLMHNPAHPGAILRAYLPEDVSVTSAASALHCSRVILSRILNGHAGVTADMAVRLADYLGTSAEYWLNLQVQYDLWQALHTRRPRVHPLTRTLTPA
jgi:antitoxin HigA-1